MSRSHSPITNSRCCDMVNRVNVIRACWFATRLLKQTSNRTAVRQGRTSEAGNEWRLLVSGARSKIAGANFITAVSETVDYCRFKRYWTVLQQIIGTRIDSPKSEFRAIAHFSFFFFHALAAFNLNFPRCKIGKYRPNFFFSSFRP